MTGRQLSPQQQQQLLQQRMNPQQQQLLRQQQQKQQLMQQQLKQARQNLPNYPFATTSQEILKKYAKYPPSLLFHIYENHFRFNNTPDSNITPKNSPMVKEFLQHVMREEIPVEMTELLKDFSIKSYDGCLILQVYDHRNLVQEKSETAPNQAQPAQNLTNVISSTDPKPEAEKPEKAQKPKTYRTLLRPTQLSLYYDLLYHTDLALTKFTDPLALQMESEILNLTNRKLNLSVPLNPYKCSDLLKPDHEYPKKVWDEKTQDYKLVHLHRDAMEKPPRKLHQDELVMHKSSEFEELMFLLSSKYKRPADQVGEQRLVVRGNTSSTANGGGTPAPEFKSEEGTPSSDKRKFREGTAPPNAPKHTSASAAAAAAAAVAGGSSATSNQFMRLRFIEEIRKRKEAQKVHNEAAVVAQAQSSGISTISGVPLPALANGTIGGPAGVGAMPSAAGTPAAMRLHQASPAPKSAVAQQQQQQQQFRKNNQSPAATAQFHPQNQQALAAKAQAQAQAQAQAVRNQQFQAQQARQQQQQQQQVKRQKMDMAPGQFSVNTTPQMGQASQPSSNVGTPVMNNMVPPSQGSNNSNNTNSQGRPQTLQQQQQQQIFQSTLSPQEQHQFRQLQTRMNTLAIMGNSGMAPNRQQLTPQQQQQAIQQAKLIQQQLLQRFPVYFQRLRQYQVIQQQRRQAAAAQLQRQQQMVNSAGPSAGAQSPQFSQNMNLNGMMPQQQMMNQQVMQMSLPQNRNFKRK